MRQFNFELTRFKQLDNSTGKSGKIGTHTYNQAVVCKLCQTMKYKLTISNKVKKYNILFDPYSKMLYICEMSMSNEALLVLQNTGTI